MSSLVSMSAGSNPKYSLCSPSMLRMAHVFALPAHTLASDFAALPPLFSVVNQAPLSYKGLLLVTAKLQALRESPFCRAAVGLLHSAMPEV